MGLPAEPKQIEHASKEIQRGVEVADAQRDVVDRGQHGCGI
jgi:hypothetical protein